VRNPERGSAMLVTLIVITALLGGAAVMSSMQISSTRSAGITRTSTSATYCAESGLAAARSVVAAGYASWAGSLYTSGTPSEPNWLSAGIGSHDLDGDGQDDFMVYLKDNDDEIGGTNNPIVDNDQAVFIVSRCTKYADSVREVEELVQQTGGGTCYQAQGGGCGGNGNSN
jgi:hypothetical protein